MFLDLSRIRGAQESFEKTYPPETFGARPETADVGDFRVAAPVSLVLEIFKDKDLFRLAGSVSTTLELLCSRCLEPFSWPVDARFDLRYQPQAANTGEGEREIREDDLTTAFYENEQIDLAQLMREQFYLSVPMKPLCGGSCQGLCAVCGTNLNRGTCTCAPVIEDPRFAVLKELRTKH
jgi:uncharacterized protein